MKHLLIIFAAVMVGCGDNGNQNSSEHNEDHLKELVKGEVLHQLEYGSQSGEVKIDVYSKYINDGAELHGDLCLKFKLYPYEKEYLQKTWIGLRHGEKYKPTVKISLRDADNFEISNHTVALVDFEFNTDDDLGKHLELDYKLRFNKNQYDRIKSAKLTNNLWPVNFLAKP